MSEGTGAASAAPSLLDLADQIRIEITAAEQGHRSALEHAIRAGALLIQAKGRMGHGEWLPWLEENFPGDRSNAANYMRLADPANVERVLHLTSIREALAAIKQPRAAKPTPTKRGKPKRKDEPTFKPGTTPAYNDKVIEWVRGLVRQGYTREQVIAFSHEGEKDFPGDKPIGNGGGYAEIRQAIYRLEEPPEDVPKSLRPARVKAGKRKREEISKEDTTKLTQARRRILDLVGFLEGIDLTGYGMSGIEQSAITAIYSDLEGLAIWLDYQLSVVGAYMNDVSTQTTIRALRMKTVANGATPSEEATAIRLIEKLEAKLAQQIHERTNG